VPPDGQSKARAKDTSRAEARRRYREQHRLDEPDLDDAPDAPEEAVAAAPSRPSMRLPDVRADLAALPGVFRDRPLVLLPFGMLLAAFLLELARQNELLPVGGIGDIAVLYIQLTLPPTALFVFFIGGFLAPKASWLVGGILGAFDALLITILVLIAPAGELESAGVTEVAEGLLPLWAIAILVGVLAAGFASWYRSFLRSSQERARANRAAREREQALKAKEQARADKAAAREAASRGRGRS
jgi:signal transduction histidine kinase